MEVSVNAQSLRFSQVILFPDGSAVRHLLERFVQHQGVCSQDFYVVCDGRRSDSDELLQDGCVYRLEPRLRGGKGGFGSMLRALGAQIEKTTNREACRDLSGRRLRDVNHEKEMADWLKKQAEREAEKEQRRAERLQRKLSEPKHMFADPKYQQQCHDLSERLEESVLKGLQASSSTQVKVSDVTATKRPSGKQSEQPPQKKKKMAACFWTGMGEMLTSEEEDDEEEEEEEEEESSTSSCKGVVSMTTPREEPESSSSPSPTEPPESSTDQTPGPAQTKPSEDPRPGSPSQKIDNVSQRPASPSSATSVEQLEALGMDALKEALVSHGLKCGGTLSERAARLFAVRGLSPDQIDPALLAKPTKSHGK